MRPHAVSAPKSESPTGVAQRAGSRHGDAAMPRAGRRPAPRPAHENVFSSGDPKADKKVARGRMTIDATLDLHGHTQASAHVALRRFIIAAHGRGDRCVLVITGKGNPAAPDRGVLRARFRDWIEEEDLRARIARAAAAHQRHGGDGAYYVFLKRGAH